MLLCTACVRLDELAVLGDMTGDGFIQWLAVWSVTVDGR